MAKRKVSINAYFRLAAAGRWRSHHTGNFMTLFVIMGIILVSAAECRAGSKITYTEKGNQTMQQAATAQSSNIPPLDASQPARVETFTFGLG
jgi:hypothetical protein